MRKTRNWLVGFAAVVLVLLVALALTERPAVSSDAGGIGRYMLAVGNYSAIAGPGLPSNEDVALARAGVFKVDTVTGETWILSERVGTGSIIAPTYERTWVKID